MITEKDFQRIADFYGIGPAKTYEANIQQNFELAKKMAADFAQWHEKNNYYYIPNADMWADLYDGQEFTNEQLLELYLNQK